SIAPSYSFFCSARLCCRPEVVANAAIFYRLLSTLYSLLSSVCSLLSTPRLRRPVRRAHPRLQSRRGASLPAGKLSGRAREFSGGPEVGPGRRCTNVQHW